MLKELWRAEKDLQLSDFYDKQTLYVFMTESTEYTNTASYCFTLFICGGPCHLSSFKQCSGDLIFL